MTKFRKNILKEQFVARYGAYLSDELIGKLVPVGTDIIALLAEDINVDRQADRDAIAEHSSSASQHNVGVVGEVAKNLAGFYEAFTADELDAIWKEIVAKSVDFKELTKVA